MAAGKANQRLAQLRNLDFGVVEIVAPEAEPWHDYLNPVDKTPAKPAVQSLTTIDDETIVDLKELLRMSLKVHYDIMKNTPLIPTNEDYIANAKLALSTAQSIIGAQIKVDENQLKARKQDDILTILQELKDEETLQAKRSLLEVALAE